MSRAVPLWQLRVFTARSSRPIVQSAVLRSHVVCPSVRPSVRLSVTLVDHDHIGWKSWKLIARTISPAFSLFVDQRSSTYSQWSINWVNRESRDLMWRCGCLLFVYFCGASRGNRYDSRAFLLNHANTPTGTGTQTQSGLHLSWLGRGARYCDECERQRVRLSVCLYLWFFCQLAYLKNHTSER